MCITHGITLVSPMLKPFHKPLCITYSLASLAVFLFSSPSKYWNPHFILFICVCVLALANSRRRARKRNGAENNTYKTATHTHTHRVARIEKTSTRKCIQKMAQMPNALQISKFQVVIVMKLSRFM